MSAKREAADRLAETARSFLRERPFSIRETGIGRELQIALNAFDSAPDDEDAGREESEGTGCQEYASGLCLSGLQERRIEPWLVPVLLKAIRDDLRALAASVKERK